MQMTTEQNQTMWESDGHREKVTAGMTAHKAAKSSALADERRPLGAPFGVGGVRCQRRAAMLMLAVCRHVRSAARCRHERSGLQKQEGLGHELLEQGGCGWKLYPRLAC